MLQIDVRRVAVEAIDAVAFTAFGTVVEPGSAEDPTLNRAPGQMAYMWVHQQLRYPRTPFIATCRYHARGARCEYLQKHPASTVVLIPLDGNPSVIWVAPDRDDEPDLGEVRAFLLERDDGVVLEWYIGAPAGDGVELTAGGAVTRLPAPDGRDLELGIGGRIIRPSPADDDGPGGHGS
jgi:ureidoglycolate hydrolase